MARYGMVIDLTTCYGCKACMASCSLENYTPFWSDQKSRKWRLKISHKEYGSYPNSKRVFIQNRCQHCSEPGCEMACPTSATYIDPNGVVQIDKESCIGCMACIDACPYDARYFYTQQDIDQEIKYFGEKLHKEPHVDKCDFCQHRIEKGIEPACAETCIGEAIQFVDLEDKNNPIVKSIKTKKAKQLHEVYGMNTSIYYIGLPEKQWKIERD